EKWKQEINLGKVVNQNFVAIPHARLIEMITYKAQLVGIEVIVNEAKFILKGVEEVTGVELLAHFPPGDIKVLAGCAPCQPFSTYSRRYGKDKSQKWKLLKDFIRLVQECDPEIVSMENVLQLRQHQVFWEFTTALEELGYIVIPYGDAINEISRL
ncbi:MAG: hypothetical protein F6K47_35030, partial [Symploca sp. SIO2E6]|nr:hypothetical protein [Symploca sp. SIO2E6]